VSPTPCAAGTSICRYSLQVASPAGRIRNVNRLSDHREYSRAGASHKRHAARAFTTGDVMFRSFFTSSSLVLFLALAGCQHYYMIQEPAGGKIYYSDHYTKDDNGAVEFKDLQTGALVTLQNNSIKEVNKGDLPDGLVH
jgi:hypothetical protein